MQVLVRNFQWRQCSKLQYALHSAGKLKLLFSTGTLTSKFDFKDTLIISILLYAYCILSSIVTVQSEKYSKRVFPDAVLSIVSFHLLLCKGYYNKGSWGCTLMHLHPRHIAGAHSELLPLWIQVALDCKQPQIQSIIPKYFLLINRTDWEREEGGQTISICIDSSCAHCFANSPALHHATFLCLVTVKNCPIKSVFQNQAFKSRRMHVHPFTHLPV